MKGFTVILVAAIAAQAYAGHKHGSVFVPPPPPPLIPLPVVAVPAKAVLPVSPPSVIDESDRNKSCPPGFSALGKQCVQTVTVRPNVFCPPGFIRSGDGYGEESCARYVGKLMECPPGYERLDGQCVETQQVDANILCPEGYVLTPDGRRCARSVHLPPVHICPPGTVQKGDHCVTRATLPPTLVCPHGFIQEGKRCRIEETYDCTPIRPPTKDAQPLIVTKEAPYLSNKHKKHLRVLGAKHGDDFSYAPNMPIIHPVPNKGSPPTKEDYVVSKTCKRIRTEAARKICPEGGILDGKDCIVEELQDLMQKPGGYREEFVPTILACPEGYYPSAPVGRFSCIARKEIAFNIFCPPGTQDVGDKCALYKPLLISCPPDYVLENEACMKTLFAQPTVEFTVTYACQGKDCDHVNHGYGGKKHH